VSKKGRGRRTFAERVKMKDNRSTIGYLRRMKTETLAELAANLQKQLDTDEPTEKR
jgi:hypothetical protein